MRFRSTGDGSSQRATDTYRLDHTTATVRASGNTDETTESKPVLQKLVHAIALEPSRASSANASSRLRKARVPPLTTVSAFEDDSVIARLVQHVVSHRFPFRTNDLAGERQQRANRPFSPCRSRLPSIWSRDSQRATFRFRLPCQ